MIRPIDRRSDEEIECVAARMRLTLIEVLGEERGGSLYTMEWLIARARFHLDPEACTGEIFVSIATDGHISGHTIVRLEPDDAGADIGLFSTIYVEPGSRRQGVAVRLIERGEEWMRERQLPEAATFTATTNERLHLLFGRLGYACADVGNGFVRLSKRLA